MIRKITLGKDNVARLGNTEPFLLPGKLAIEFESNYDLTTAFISLKNGKIEGIIPLKKHLEIPSEFLFAGTLNLAVKLYHRDTVVKEWYCLPIRIIETEFGIQAFDLLGDIEKRLKAIEESATTKEEHKVLTEAFNELASSFNTLVETVSQIKEN